jgi:hypothetical protein
MLMLYTIVQEINSYDLVKIFLFDLLVPDDVLNVVIGEMVFRSWFSFLDR